MKSLIFILLSGCLIANTASAQPNTPYLDKREALQQKRINAGISTGQLDPAEAAALHSREARIQRTENRALADGVLTDRERRHLKHELNAESRRIYRQKHD